MTYLILKYLHVFGAIVLLGTGAGIAFFMLMAHLSQDAAFIGKTARVVVLADLIFTVSAVVAQPVTGALLLYETGLALGESWVVLSLVLYGVAGLFWLPVVWIQTRLRDLALAAARDGTPLPVQYQRLFGVWFVFGFPGFGAVAGILWLMLAKPVLW